MDDNSIVIVITGESGSGKSYIQRNLLSKYPNIDIITKYTSRKSRQDEINSIDTVGNISPREMKKMNYTYINPLNHEMYGFIKTDIDQSIAQGKIPCIAITNENSYKQLVNDYHNRVLLLKVIPYYSEESMKEVFQNQGRSLEEWEERRQVLMNPLTGWTEDCDNMREIINPYFVRNLSSEISNDIIFTRLEFILGEELNKNLGASYSTSISSGIYSYLYYYSKNRPIDKELTIPRDTVNKRGRVA